MNNNIQNICVKFMMNEANIKELETLEKWIVAPKNKQVFARYIKVNYAIDMNMNLYNVESAKQELLKKIKQDKRRYKTIRLYKRVRYAAAAILVIALASTYFLRDQIFNKTIEQTTPIIVNNQIEPGTDKATLTLEDGKVVTLEKGNIYQTPNATSNGEEIIYKAGERNKKEIAFNTLTIPRGGQYNMVLADDTKVWLNSESQIKYPIAFTEGQTRQVELLYGEAYFDVSPSTEHKGSKFKVYHKAQEVEVLGTEFNIKAYKDETNIYTTLVEGKVSVSSETNNRILKPTEQSNLDVLTNSLHVAVVDVQSQTSWKDGKFIFNEKSLKEIMKVLCRWYDMDVQYEKEELKSVILTGVFKKSQSIEEILQALQNTKFINGYEIHNKTIILK